MPAQKPAESNQVVGTPWDFVHAVERRFGPLSIDLAALATNSKAPLFVSPEVDTLAIDWRALVPGDHKSSVNMWLNPEYSEIAPYAKKCAESCGTPTTDGPTIFLLVPASVGSQWYWNYVHGRALVHVLYPRLTFEGHADPYPKDLILAAYGPPPGFVRGLWKEW